MLKSLKDLPPLTPIGEGSDFEVSDLIPDSRPYYGGRFVLLPAMAVSVVVTPAPSLEALSNNVLTQAALHRQQFLSFCTEQGVEMPIAWSYGETATEGIKMTSEMIQELSGAAFKRCFPNLESFYQGEDLTRVEVDEGENFLQELFQELVDTLCDPEKLAEILAEVAISTGLYLCWEMIKKLQRRFRREGKSEEEGGGKGGSNRFVEWIACQYTKILHYFEKVPKSRITEISKGTGVPKEEARLLLRLMCFIHESNYFWRPPASGMKNTKKPSIVDVCSRKSPGAGRV